MNLPYKQCYGADLCPVHPVTGFWPVDSVLSYGCTYKPRTIHYIEKMRKIVL